MKFTSLILSAVAATGVVLWSDLHESPSPRNSWSDSGLERQYLGDCVATGVNADVCSCMLKHIRSEQTASSLPAVSAGPTGARQWPDPTSAYHGYRESCERWAEILGLGDDSGRPSDATPR